MKNMISAFLISLLAIAVGLLSGACSSGADQSSSQSSQTSSAGEAGDHDVGHMEHMGDLKHMDFSQHRTDRSAGLIDAYEKIYKSLDADNKAAAADGAKTMLAAIHGFESLDIDSSQAKESSEIIESVKEHAEHITKSELSHQKEHFEEMANDLNDLFKLIGQKNSN